MEQVAKIFKKSFILLAILSGTTLTAWAEPTPLACWPFEFEDNPEDGYSDSCGNYPLTPSGTLSFSSDKAPTAEGAKSINISGSGGHLSSTLLPPLNNFSIELFFRSAQATGIHMIMTAFDHTECCDRSPHPRDGVGGWHLHLWNGKIRFRQSHYGATRQNVELVSCGSFADNQWHHLVVSFSETNLMRMYIDGVFQGETQDTRSSDPDRNPIRLGRTWYTCCASFETPYNYIGGLDEVRVYEGVATPPGDSPVPCSESNLPPVADAGPDQQGVSRGTLVTLDGSASSDLDGDNPLTYSWELSSIPERSQAALADPTSVNPSFTVDLPGDYIASLTVTDAQGLSGAPDEVLVSTTNTASVADAGVDEVLTERGTTVQLDGTQSFDLEGDELTFAWTLLQKPSSSIAALSDPTSPTPTFVADIPGDYVVRLVVTDVFGAESAPDTVLVSFNNVPPVADAGDTQTVLVGTTVQLDGSGSSDANLDPLTFDWSIGSKPAGSVAVLNNSTATAPSFKADKQGLYDITLVVNDGTVNSALSQVTIMAITTQDRLMQTLSRAIDILNELSDEVFDNKNHKDRLTEEIAKVQNQIQQGAFMGAYNKLEQTVLKRLDGCASTPPNTKDDWITDCGAQEQVYPLIIEALELLATLR